MYDFTVNDAAGHPVSLGEDRFRGKVICVVNTASKCGLKSQLGELEALYRAHKDAGFLVLAFPCEQFLHQEPLEGEAIGACYRTTFDVDYPVFEKIEVNGPGAHPLYAFLTEAQRGALGSRKIKWNFTKFLVDRAGVPVARYSPTTKPEAMVPKMLELLGQ
eukprot:gnl/Ergobibamus_cyprinoides/2356.p4 GENE.gnl/Ergobibamus_cyprinoides/2356~~gnl/Ergobibamus_cyprinoides/2356.p4  ORF type:complete len:161 (-),score=68.47 gnl/Ergobibamus_cyprinoides/2356:41-523(-)